MNKSVFEFTNYKLYLQHWLTGLPGSGRGMQAKIAKAIGCQSGYVSQALNTSAHFSLEQAEALNAFLGHTQEEANFFLLLVQFNRAGTPALKNRLKQQLDQALAQHLDFKNRIDIKKSLESVDQSTYYSAWYYAAIHVAISISSLRTREALASYFNLSPETTSEVLNFLVSVGLLEKKGAEYFQGVSRLFLDKQSPMIRKHHNNWRIRAIHSLDKGIQKNLHFSSVLTVKTSDIPIIQEQIIQSVEAIRTLVRESPEEEVCAFNVDFFRLKDKV